MNIVFHFDGSAALRARVASMGVELCPESDKAAFARLLPEVEVLWHVLKPVTAEVIARVTGEGFGLLDVAPMRLNAKDTPVPYHPDLWSVHRPTANAIAEATRRLLHI